MNRILSSVDCVCSRTVAAPRVSPWSIFSITAWIAVCNSREKPDSVSLRSQLSNVSPFSTARTRAPSSWRARPYAARFSSRCSTSCTILWSLLAAGSPVLSMLPSLHSSRNLRCSIATSSSNQAMRRSKLSCRLEVVDSTVLTSVTLMLLRGRTGEACEGLPIRGERVCMGEAGRAFWVSDCMLET